MTTLFNWRKLLPALMLCISFSACEQAPSENIAQVAVANENLSTLVAALGAAELVPALEGEGPLTVFAPVNGAFEDLPEGLVDALLKPENKEVLKQILTYHVVTGQFKAADVTAAIEQGGGSAELQALSGAKIIASAVDGKVILKDEQGNEIEVTATDVTASNGVIHLIDGVLIPGSVNPADLLPKPNIVAVASGNEQFSTLVAAVQAGGLVETLQGEGPFTVFAPVNAAFEALPEGTLETLLKPENKEQLAGILTYHVVAGEFKAAQVIEAINSNDGAFTIPTVNGAALTASLDGDKVILTDGAGNKATVLVTDVPASNGVIHAIDSVVLPQ